MAEVDRARGGRRRREPSEEGAEIVTRDYKVEVSGKLFDVKVIGEAVAGAAAPGRGRQEAAETRAQGRRGGAARLERVAALAAAGHRPQSRGRAGRRGRRGRPDLRDRGDEDGERDHRPPRRQGHRAERRRGRRGRPAATSSPSSSSAPASRRGTGAGAGVCLFCVLFFAFLRAFRSFAFRVRSFARPALLDRGSAGVLSATSWQVRPTQSSSADQFVVEEVADREVVGVADDVVELVGVLVDVVELLLAVRPLDVLVGAEADSVVVLGRRDDRGVAPLARFARPRLARCAPRCRAAGRGSGRRSPPPFCFDVVGLDEGLEEERPPGAQARGRA